MAKNFLAIIRNRQHDDITDLKSGAVLYAPIDSNNFNPLFIRNEDEQILITPQDSIEPEQLMVLFGEEPITPEKVYNFSEDRFSLVFGEDPELLPDFISFLERIEEHFKEDEESDFEAEQFLDLLIALKSELKVSTVHLFYNLDSINLNGLKRLMNTFITERGLLRETYLGLFKGSDDYGEE